MRILIAAFILTGCASLPKPLHDNANGNFLSGTCWRSAEQAKRGDQQAFHTCFFAAYSRARDPMVGGEDLESIYESVHGLLAAVGDDAFAAALSAESPPVRNGVGYFLFMFPLDAPYPKTTAVIHATPHYEMELEKANARTNA